MKKRTISLFNVHKAYQIRKSDIDRAIKRVLRSSSYILGENVKAFEQEFASYSKATYAVAVASGTDALILSLKALGIGNGDEVLVPANSYPTVFPVLWVGATPKPIDVRFDSFTIDPDKIEHAISEKTRAIIPVHLYGRAANMDSILRIARNHRLFVVEDAAQAHGASYRGKHLGTLGTVGCFSFYPTKNLGCFGDGGMVITKSKRVSDAVRRLRMYGEKRRYESVTLGTNSRLDELQAAILRLGLKKLDGGNKKRQTIAAWYRSSLNGLPISLPDNPQDNSHIYHLFVIRTKKRRELKNFLAANGVQTGIHFPIPIHLVRSLRHLGFKRGSFPNAEKLSKEILSLPCHPTLTKGDILFIASLVKRFFT